MAVYVAPPQLMIDIVPLSAHNAAMLATAVDVVSVMVTG